MRGSTVWDHITWRHFEVERFLSLLKTRSLSLVAIARIYIRTKPHGYLLSTALSQPYPPSSSQIGLHLDLIRDQASRNSQATNRVARFNTTHSRSRRQIAGDWSIAEASPRYWDLFVIATLWPVLRTNSVFRIVSPKPMFDGRPTARQHQPYGPTDCETFISARSAF